MRFEFQGFELELTSRKLERIARNSRITALQMSYSSKSSHIGSALSCIDVLTLLLCAKQKLEEMESGTTLEVVCSKGHAAMAVYSVLREIGELNEEKVLNYCKDGSQLYGHINHLAHSWIPLSTGSLGHGMPFSLGMAMSLKKERKAGHIFALVSDGELDEGTTWESALIANAFGVDNFSVLIDYNKIQSFGRVEDVTPLEPLREKWESFGWKVTELNGNSMEELIDALSGVSGLNAFVLNTKKGSGVSFMEDSLQWHYKSPSLQELELAFAELNSEIPKETREK